jgi:hypothetical protein
MSEVSAGLLSKIRDSLAETKETKLTKEILSMDDAALTKLLFKPSFRIRTDGEAYTLSHIGYKVLTSCFRYWEIKLNAPLSGNELLILKHNAKLPYYYSSGKLAVFERELGFLLRLGEGIDNPVKNILG